jgi:hypothetical protein
MKEQEFTAPAAAAAAARHGSESRNYVEIEQPSIFSTKIP